MIRFCVAAFCVASLALLAHADSIATLVNCGSTSGASTCSTMDSFGNIESAAASGAYLVSGNTLSFELADSASSVGYGSSFGVSAGLLYLSTKGPLRPGFVLVSGTVEATQTTSDASNVVDSFAGYELGDNSGTLVQAGCFSSTGCVNSEGLQPVVLGETLGFIESGDAGAETFQGSGEANASLDFTLQFLEADGVTPVNVMQTPEPSGLKLVAAALICWFLLRRTRFCFAITDAINV